MYAMNRIGKMICVLLLCFVFVPSIQVEVSAGESYLGDLPEITHPYLFQWKFEEGATGPGGSNASGLVPIDEELLGKLQTLTHPQLFKWKFSGPASRTTASDGSNFPLDTKFLEDLQVFTHPYLFKWKFSDRDIVEEVPVVEEIKVVEPEKKVEEKTLPEREDKPVEWISLPVRTVYFDYDKSALKPEGKEAIRKNVAFLKENSNFNVLIEGHCDERGTQEYNLALGERRAQSIRSFMTEMGISSSRITTKTWGEELPVALGHNEAAWSQNRRGEMYYSRPE
jgi:peptidoglycan-associated lipoprotein